MTTDSSYVEAVHSKGCSSCPPSCNDCTGDNGTCECYKHGGPFTISTDYLGEGDKLSIHVVESLDLVRSNIVCTGKRAICNCENCDALRTYGTWGRREGEGT